MRACLRCWMIRACATEGGAGAQGGGRATQSTSRHPGSTATCRGCRGGWGCWASSKPWYGWLEVARREEEKSLARRSHRPAERPGQAQRVHAPTRGSIDGNVREDPPDDSHGWRPLAEASLPRRAVAVLVQLGSDGAWQALAMPRRRWAAGLAGSRPGCSRRHVGQRCRPARRVSAQIHQRPSPAAAPCPLARITGPRVRAGRREHTVRGMGHSAGSTWHQTMSRRHQHRGAGGHEPRVLTV